MKYPLLILLASISFAHADELTIAKCMQISAGLKALDYAGAQLNDKSPPPADAKQYKLGALRWKISANLSAIEPILTEFERGRVALIAELGAGKPINANSPEMTALLAEMQKALDRPCKAQLTKMSGAEFRVGDEPGQNAIPPSVLSALSPIITE